MAASSARMENTTPAIMPASTPANNTTSTVNYTVTPNDVTAGTATVTIPDASRGYNVYLYDDFDKVPVRDFNASAANAG